MARKVGDIKNACGYVQQSLGITRKELANALGVVDIVINRWFTRKARPRLYLDQVHALMIATNKTLPELIEILDPGANKTERIS